MDFAEALRELGFAPSGDRPAVKGSQIHISRPNRFLTYFVHTYTDGSALLTFEFAIAEYLATRGLQVGSSEELNQFLYPRTDLRGTQDGAWLADAIDQAEGLLAGVRLDDPQNAGDEPSDGTPS